MTWHEQVFKLDWIERLRVEYEPLRDFTNNTWYGPIDFEALYCVVRRYQPRLVIEVGCGHSTHAIRLALAANGVGDLLCIDPSPRINLSETRHIRSELAKAMPQLLPLIGSVGMLVSDSWHDGEVAKLVLHELYPRLPPGALVGFHDIQLPHQPLPAVAPENRVLNAFLGASKPQVVFPAYHLWVTRGMEMRALFPSCLKAEREGWPVFHHGPSCFYLRKPHPRDGNVWRDERFGALDDFSKLVYLGMCEFYTTHGELPHDTRLLRAALFPYRSDIVLDAALAAVLDAGLFRHTSE